MGFCIRRVPHRGQTCGSHTFALVSSMPRPPILARARYGRVQPALEDMVAEKRLICLPADDRVPRSCGRGAGRKREQTLMEPRGLQPLTLSLELEKAGLTKDDAELFQRHLPSGLRQQRTQTPTQIQTQTQTQTQAQA